MQILLSARDSTRWTSGGPERARVEAAVRGWAQAHAAGEPVVVILHDGRTAFAWTVGGAA
jgi:hypothetical protein